MVNRKSVVAACGAVIAVLVMTAAASGSAIFLTQANQVTFTGHPPSGSTASFC